ncbi:3-demethylubiquinone-9 3-methyltransferase [Bremerella volcania]|uniref:3-demethylubiquinone-9 3-methyltransferase n=1 Tax=Bremerella volcania TaxID=2527984 RepID=A0A518CDF2_9BACT|nr:VOC family protein [Bremerella volcania]QDU77259.1 3-demethylubiquinone-9 3-methyltransferase [Bremerella volcania]
MPRITPFLWFDDQAQEAVNFYLSIFDDSRILTQTRYGEVGPGPEGSIMTIEFELQGQTFVALNGGPHFTFNESVSFVVNCETAEEVDHYWEKLSEGGEKSHCGWLKDKFGVSWQVVPTLLQSLISDANQTKAQMVIAAMLQMQKLDVVALQTAYDDA